MQEAPRGWRRRNLELSLSLGVDQGQGQSQCPGKDNAQGDASMRRPRHRQERRKRRRQHETLRASPTQVSAVPPPRYPQVGKTVEGDEIAKRQRITGRVVPRYLWEGKTMEGTTPPPEHSAFLDTQGRYGVVVAGLSLGVGAGHYESRDGSLWC